MGFEEIIGQKLIVKALKGSLERWEIGHAYLFSGPPGSGKKTIATLFAQALNCTGKNNPPCGECLSCRKTKNGSHPDLFCLVPGGPSLKIEQIREIKESLYYFPVEGRKKICLIYEADRLTLPAANSLLKILEEPPEDLVFILLSSRPWSLPPTVLSRCFHFSLKPLEEREIELILSKHLALLPEEKKIIVALAGGNPGKALDLATRGEWKEVLFQSLELLEQVETSLPENIFSLGERLSNRDDLEKILEMLLIIFRDRLILKLGLLSEKMLIMDPEIIKNNYRKERAGGFSFGRREESKYFLEKICRVLLEIQEELQGNVNRRLALETLFLKMRGVV